MKKIIKDTAILFIITLVTGFLIGLVYQVTKEARAEQDIKAKEKAYKEVYVGDEYKTVDFDSDEMNTVLKDNGLDKALIDEIVEVVDNNETVGYIITVTDKEGYGGDIQFAMGVSNEGEITGISYLSISETAGVGMKVTEDSFTSRFKGKVSEKISYTKNGAAGDDEIDAISGATVSTSAVTNGVNAGLCAYRYVSGESDSDESNTNTDSSVKNDTDVGGEENE